MSTSFPTPSSGVIDYSSRSPDTKWFSNVVFPARVLASLAWFAPIVWLVTAAALLPYHLDVSLANNAAHLAEAIGAILSPHAFLCCIGLWCVNAALAYLQTRVFTLGPVVDASAWGMFKLYVHPSRVVVYILHGLAGVASVWLIVNCFGVALVAPDVAEAIESYAARESQLRHYELDEHHRLARQLAANASMVYLISFILGAVHAVRFFAAQHQQLAFPSIRQKKIFGLKRLLWSGAKYGLAEAFLGAVAAFGAVSLLGYFFYAVVFDLYKDVGAFVGCVLGFKCVTPKHSAGYMFQLHQPTSLALFFKVWLFLLTPTLVLIKCRELLFELFLIEPIHFPLVSAAADEQPQTVLAGLAAARIPASPATGNKVLNESGTRIHSAHAENTRALLRHLAFQDLVFHLTHSAASRSLVFSAGQPAALLFAGSSVRSQSSGPTLLERIVKECLLVVNTMTAKLIDASPSSGSGGGGFGLSDQESDALALLALMEEEEALARARENQSKVQPEQHSALADMFAPPKASSPNMLLDFALRLYRDSAALVRQGLRLVWRKATLRPLPRALLDPAVRPAPSESASRFYANKAKSYTLQTQQQQQQQRSGSSLPTKARSFLANAPLVRPAFQESPLLKAQIVYAELQLTLWAVEALSLIVAHAIEQDEAGGSRKLIATIVSALLDLSSAIELHGRGSLLRLQFTGSSRQQSPGTALSLCVKSCIYRITNVFGSSIFLYDLSQANTTKLQHFLDFVE